MLAAKIASASIVLVAAIVTAANIWIGGEPSPVLAGAAVVGVVQYAILNER